MRKLKKLILMIIEIGERYKRIGIQKKLSERDALK